jgi:hypothetical protein
MSLILTLPTEVDRIVKARAALLGIPKHDYLVGIVMESVLGKDTGK